MDEIIFLILEKQRRFTEKVRSGLLYTCVDYAATLDISGTIQWKV